MEHGKATKIHIESLIPLDDWWISECTLNRFQYFLCNFNFSAINRVCRMHIWFNSLLVFAASNIENNQSVSRCSLLKWIFEKGKFMFSERWTLRYLSIFTILKKPFKRSLYNFPWLNILIFSSANRPPFLKNISTGFKTYLLSHIPVTLTWAKLAINLFEQKSDGVLRLKGKKVNGARRKMQICFCSLSIFYRLWFYFNLIIPMIKDRFKSGLRTISEGKYALRRRVLSFNSLSKSCKQFQQCNIS